MMPTLIPSVQNMAMAESSRMVRLLLNQRMPKPDSMENAPAPNKGEKPK